eukprot:TRINITY_DN13700_c0_g1_i2.p3 TRINITY_DN13700_c0_g1~~TRINITY_DN13700_c0_g1_i2.p3  ORF type:complete len:137 (+),score=17.38 TRINITY_DN13700_c0_g1_i2:171-581(+)
MLYLVRKLDLLDGRFAGEVGLNGGYESRLEVHDCLREVEEIELELQPPGGNGMIDRINKLVGVVGMLKQKQQYREAGNSSLSEADTQRVMSLLQLFNESIQQLQEVIRKQNRDLQIMEFGEQSINGMSLEVIGRTS